MIPGIPLDQVKLFPGSSAVILNFAGGSSGCRMIARLPTAIDLSSSSTLVTDRNAEVSHVDSSHLRST